MSNLRTTTMIERHGSVGVLSCLCVFVLAIASSTSQAVVAAGEDVQLQSLTVSGGGGVGLTNPGSGATATANLLIGQSSPVGVSEGVVSGVRVEFGAIPARGAAIPIPEPARLALFLSALATLGLLRGNLRRGRAA